MKEAGITGLGAMEGGTLDGAVQRADVKGRLEQVHEGTEGNMPRRSTDESWENVCCMERQQNGEGNMGMDANWVEDRFEIPGCVSSCPVPYWRQHPAPREFSTVSRKQRSQFCYWICIKPDGVVHHKSPLMVLPRQK